MIETARAFLEGQSLKPLFATISGAHLYGFESPDSDLDLRGAFVAGLDEVLGLKSYEDTRTVSQGDMDFVAHDVLKFCRLMTRRNGYVLEQLYSPLVVWGGPWFEELQEIGKGCRVRHVYYHYRGFLHNQRKLLDKAEPTVKELLYAYRVVHTGIHFLITGEVQPHLPSLQPDSVIQDLIARKRQGGEFQNLRPGEYEEHRQRLDGLEGKLDEAFQNSRLPEEIPNLDELNDYVIRARKELG